MTESVPNGALAQEVLALTAEWRVPSPRLPSQGGAACRVSVAERRALLVSAAVLMEEALRLLDQGECSIAGVWLAHAAECLGYQLDAME